MSTYVLDVRTATPHFPGIGRYVANLVRAISPLLEGDERLVLPWDASQPSAPIVAELSDAGPVKLMAVPVSPFSLQQQWAIPRLLRRCEASLYHSPYYLMPYRPGVPTVVTLYDLIPLLFPATVSFRARLLFRWTTRLALGAAQHVIVISEASRRDLLDRFSLRADTVTAVPLAADPRFRPCLPEEVQQVRERYGLPPAYVLYLGINKPHKNLVRLVEAWAQLPSEPRQLVIAGAWDERYPAPRQRAAQLELSQRVRFLGRVADSDLPALYSGADLFVFPSRYEGFGLPIVEAMACGAPVACGNTSSLPEVAGDAALLFPPEDTGAMAAAIERALADETLRAELRKRGLVQAGQFSWQRTAAETLAIYRRLTFQHNIHSV